MVHALLDANIFEEILKDGESGELLVQQTMRDPELVVHNFRPVRRKLRKTPGGVVLHDKLAKGPTIAGNSVIKGLAQQYQELFCKTGREVVGSEILDGFKLVACASLKSFDVVVFRDLSAVCDPAAVQAYWQVNEGFQLRTPQIVSYDDLKRRYL